MIKEDRMPRMMVLMVGIPGSGKTWFRDKLFQDAEVICPDDAIGYTKERPWTPDAAKAAWHKADERMRRAMDADGPEIVLLDATNTSPKRRGKYIRMVAKAGIQAVAVFCDTPSSVCCNRNGSRPLGRRVPHTTIARMLANLEPPSLNEGFDLVVKADPMAGRYEIKASAECLCCQAMLDRLSCVRDRSLRSLSVSKG